MKKLFMILDNEVFYGKVWVTLHWWRYLWRYTKK